MYLLLVIIIFLIGLSGIFFSQKHLITLLMCIELMLLSINIGFIIFSVHFDDILGQLISLFILTVAAAESAIGLAILVIYYRLKNIIYIDLISFIKG